MILLTRIWHSRRLVSGLTYWLWVYGLPITVAISGLLLVSGFLNGWWVTYNLLIGIDSPRDAHATWLSFAVSLLGWLAVPAITGGIVGYAVSKQISTYRDKSSSAEVMTELEKSLDPVEKEKLGDDFRH